MKLIIGLGNSEPRYDNTRHNVGFRVLDKLASKWGTSFKRQDKFYADVAEMTFDGEKILLVKPTTYYNEVGRSARAILDFYKLELSDVLVVHDDLALPLGTIRTRIGGSDAGNNGLKSLHAHIGSGTARVRIGISNDMRVQFGDADFVLAKFSKSELHALSELHGTIDTYIDRFIAGSFTPDTYSSE